MTVSVYRHCEEERRSNPVKNNVLNHFTSMVILNFIISKASCATGTGGLAKLGGKVITRTSVRPLSVSGNPNGVQSNPNFAKPQRRWLQRGKSEVDKAAESKNEIKYYENNESIKKSCNFVILKM